MRFSWGRWRVVAAVRKIMLDRASLDAGLGQFVCGA
jgi:hypothetical protein